MVLSCLNYAIGMKVYAAKKSVPEQMSKEIL